MESEYDKKFSEMKKYIPFLENMIKKLEMSGTGTDNPRHAQLSKIKALRDLLQERSKRMKMENLLKCEQVLINLYAKVEQRDTLPGIQKAHERKTSSDRDSSKLESVRNKLKKISMESETRGRETLPEIDRAHGTDLDCTPGSKEPALFQKRPNKYPSPENHPSKSFEGYPRGPWSRTRVLVSPERSSSHWSNQSEKDLYRRRSPQRSSRSPRCRSPRRRSPYYKKDKKKKKDHEKSGKKSSENVNIMLNVPEDTMDSLNTSDICERIINCEDNDVDIDTLRDLKKQIMKELKHTKNKDNIFKKLLKKGSSNEKVTEAEEGEISDSESEAIERIYGSLVLVNNENDKLDSSHCSGSKQSKDRKLQICLKFVPKSDNQSDEDENVNADNANDLDGNSYSKRNNQIRLPDPDVELVIDEPTLEESKQDTSTKPNVVANKNDPPTTKVKSNTNENNTPKNIEKPEENDDKKNNISETPKCTKANNIVSFLEDMSPPVNHVAKHIPVCQPDLMPTGANFYKQIVPEDDSIPKPDKKQTELNTIPTKNKDSPKPNQNPINTDKQNVKPNSEKSLDKNSVTPKLNPKESQIESSQYQIPFLSEAEMPITNKTPKNDSVTEIDILQALKNEILNEKMSIPGEDSEPPALHQPKIITKVTDAKEISSKKKISLEKYKAQSSQSTVKPRIYKYKPNLPVSRGLTVKECERFNFPVELALSDESPVEDEDEESNKPTVYDDLIPQSPDHADTDNTIMTNSPRIIPAEPLNKGKALIAPTDIDMRTLSPKKSEAVTPVRSDVEITRPKDPRLRKDTVSLNPNSTPRQIPFSNMTPSRTPSMSFEITPSHVGFDVEANSSSKRHVYAPSMSYNEPVESNDRNYNSEWDDDRRQNLSTNRESYRSDRKDDYYSQAECPRTPSHYFGRGDNTDGSSTSAHPFSRGDYNNTTSHAYVRNESSATPRHGYSREMPSTPIHPFGRSEKPSTPIHPFGRSEMPTTPIHPFGRNEKPSTPIHPFGRKEVVSSSSSHSYGRHDAPRTPIHPFGRSDAPSTPIHQFGRSDAPSTPIHPFGRSDGSSTPAHSFSRSDGSSTPAHSFGRSDAPSTPIHPFGRSDASSTPAHSFGRSDGSSTPIHPFGRTNVTSTPAHSFDRNDTPTTPIHPFGRSEVPKTPVHPYGRDASNSHSRNDPKSTSQRSEDYNRSYDSRSDFKSQYSQNAQNSRSYSSETYRNREKSVDRNRAYPSDRYSTQSALQISEKDYSRGMSSSRGESDRYARERSVGRISDSYSHQSRSNQYAENDPRNVTSNEKYDRFNYERSHARGQSVGRSYPFSTTSDNSMQYREKSVGKQYEEQNKDRQNETNSKYYHEQSSRTHENRAFVRARSVGRMFEKDSNTVSVQAHAGRSFTIDTSVNSTFQLNLPSEGIVFDKLFDARRQRAASVGRSLHDKSVSRSINTEHKSIFQTQNICRSNIADSNVYPHSSISTTNCINSDRFNRAKSVGREILSSNKSLKDIRAEFESFRTKNLQALEQKSTYRKSPTEKKDYDFSSRNKVVAPASYKNPYKIDRMSRKDSYKKQHQSKVDKDAYSPRKNLRDPRFNRHQGHTSKRFNYVPPHERHRSDKKNYGIVYTDHNISQGKILGPGSGVKNYRIPKIKRPEPEIQQTEEKETVEESKDKKSDDMTLLDRIDELISSPTKTPVSSSKDENNEIKNSPKRSPQKMKIDSPKEGSPMITRSRRSNVIYDSDSGKEDVKEPTASKSSKQDTIKSQDEVKSAEKIKLTPDTKNSDSLMFDDLDDDDTSSEKTSDDVLNNINALIAGLDKEMSTKIYDCSIAEDISSAVKAKADSETVSAPVTSNTLDKENNQITYLTDLTPKEITDNTNKVQSDSVCSSNKAKEVSDSEFHKDPEYPAEETDAKLPEANSQSNEFELDKQSNEQTDIVSTSNAGDDSITITIENALLIPTSCSSPDSTINTEDIDAKTKATETTNTEPNAQIEVGADITSTNTVVESVAPIQEDQVNKTGLSSILNTIKDLLSKLDDPSEHEKIKLKLETLTKIVSSAEPCTTDAKKSTDSTAPNKSEAEKCELDVKEDEKEAVTKEDNIEDSKLLSPQHNPNEIDTDIDNDLSENKEKKEEKKKTSSVTASPISVEKTSSDANVEPWNDAQETATNQLNESFSNDDEPLVRKSTRKLQQGKGKGKRGRRKRKVGPKAKKPLNVRVTRSADNVSKTKKKLSRELQQLQDDLRENMFNNQDVISTTGIRMCRLAKLEESVSKESSESPKQKETKKVIDVPPADATPLGSKPLVVLEKIPTKTELVKPLRKKPGPKPKPKPLPSEQHKPGPGPKSMTKPRPGTPKFFEKDPFLFEYDSVSEATTNANDSSETSESEAETLASSVSFTSNTEPEKPKPKRKKRAWQAGIIKTKRTKKKVNKKQDIEHNRVPTKMGQIISNIPDIGSFTDKNCCFSKDVFTYGCKLCMFEGEDIVKHYKICHPHYEIPMSRMSPSIAIESIHQSIATNFQAMKQITVHKYICRFCFQTIAGGKSSLENFFWHVVSTHTGEFKHFCSECRDETPCTFMLDTPPPPKGTNNLLMGFICEKCNFTQVSLENLKSHVSIRHNDEETEVYAISLGVLSPHIIKTAETKKTTPKEKTRTLRSRRSKQNYDENSDDTTDNDEALKTIANKQTTDFKSRIVFEKDPQDDSDIKDDVLEQDDDLQQEKSLEPNATNQDDKIHDKEPDNNENLYLLSHFKSSYTKAGIKEYICCINGHDNHYKTSLLISMKKHVQSKHQESWDGYCHFCKVIVMPQGKHHFKDCLAHYLQNHMDNIPEIEPDIIQSPVDKKKPATPTKPVINVRPLAELLSSPSVSTNEEIFPKIESIVSLNTESSSNEVQIQAENKQIKIAGENIVFEETQKDIISKKHRVALDTMMSKEKLSHIFKCAGRFCSFSCNSPEDALLHASTHSKREDSSAMKCAYCSVNTSGNAIDLVSHVFKTHGCCQFSCGKCFYRASAVQLVESHYARAHGVVTNGAVIKASTVIPSQDTVQSLSRIDAVAFYECSQEINDTKCKFKTYTQSKFVEHHEQKHPGAQPRCQICDFVASDFPNLIVHLAIHGLSLYQCTWCIYGGENETDILSHLSARHPSRRPQAYLRQIMEAKDGTLKQLPMVYVSNKSSVAPIEITQTKVVENPVKEAERSADLETLIGQTMQLTENTNVSQDAHPEETNEDILESSSVTAAPPPTTPTNASAVEEQTTPVLEKVKSEPAPIPISLNSSEIVCLDTDDEDTTVNSLDHSDDSNMASQLSSPNRNLSSLYKCGNCLQTYKSSQSFRYHINSGHVSEAIKCFYCNYVTHNRKFVLKHYTEMHGPKKKKIYECAICKVHENTLKNIKKHCLQAHGYKSVAENLQSYEDGVERILVSQFTPRAAPKRKKSVPETAPTPAKVRRYSPNEVDLLPIKHILDDPVQCSICEFTSKIRLNIIRHLRAHEQQQPVPQIAPVNPVPHLQSNEMHFDKMVNLASSSIQPSKPSQKQDNVTKVLDFLPPNIASRYPKYIPERQRYACGAKQCSYISIDEAMLKCHWEALHSGSNDFLCVHCPSSQELDKSQPLTAARIIAHLKMHDMRLFACSLCPYYHHQQYIVEKHITEKHNTNGEVRIVRNSANSPQHQTSAPALAQNAAPTMDLKPWQCGLCDFKSMLRQEVVEHCSRFHASKFQYKCAFCPWRSSTLENVTKHQAGHAGMSGEIFYFYYREGFLPEDPSMPRWKKQRIMMKLPAEPEVKAETVEATTQPQIPITIDLNLVKKEVEDTTDKEMSDGGLCKKYGEYCDPIGLKYLCPLCKVTTEEMRQTMQAHLYEELQYRKWSCAVCSYKSYHKKALQDHTFQEHRQNKEPLELATDVQLEEWIDNLLNHQDQKIKENLDKIQASKNNTLTRQDTASPSRSSPSSSTTSITSTPTKVTQAPKESSLQKNLKELEAAFGSFGSPSNSMFCCPKCDFKAQEENKMYQHLESELAKIRWCCTQCPMNFHVYHMAQLHCKSVHPGQNARAVGAIKDPKTREEWIQTVIKHQKQNMSVLLNDNNEEAPENSLLMVRYEKDVPIPDIANTQPSTSSETSRRRNRRSSAQSAGDGESDDERLVIDENESSSDEFEEPKKKSENKKKCQYCDFETVYKSCLSDHTLRHYNLKPYKCHYCNFSSYGKIVEKHCVNMHSERAVVVDKVQIPDTPPTNLSLPHYQRVRKKKAEPAAEVAAKKLPDLICLICGCNVDSDQVNFHTHANHEKQIVEMNNVVVKCGICDAMRKTIIDIKSHYNSEHAGLEINYAYHKLNSVTTNVTCLVEDCDKVCRLRDIESHHTKTHTGKPLTYTLRSVGTGPKKPEAAATGVKRPLEEAEIPQKRIAKKSTTKLPFQEPRLMFDMDPNQASGSPTYTQEDSFGC